MGIESVDFAVFESTKPTGAGRREQARVAGARFRKSATDAGVQKVGMTARKQKPDNVSMMVNYIVKLTKHVAEQEKVNVKSFIREEVQHVNLLLTVRLMT